MENINPIVGIGELLWDVYPNGRKVAGGAPFNFAFHCHQLGHPAAIVSRVGNDKLGDDLRAEVRRLGLRDEYIQTDAERTTGTVQVTLDSARVPTYTITENAAWDYIESCPSLAVLAEYATAVCFGTLAQRSAESRATIQSLLATTRGTNCCVFDVNLRTQKIDLEMLSNSLSRADWVKVNEEEIAVIVDRFGVAPVSADLAGSIEALRTRIQDNNKLILVTRGELGCQLYSPQFTPQGHMTEPAVSARVVDTVGAGDAFTAAMVCLHLEGHPLRKCARFANHYAARVCEHHGATPRIDRREVELTAFGT